MLLASLLTGDPLLLIGNHGCAKTHVANKVAQALGRRFLAYDASKAHVRGYSWLSERPEAADGVVEYVPSPGHHMGQGIDPHRRTEPRPESLQSKWLECIRSRKIMGFHTQVKWVWAAMNPVSYAAANVLDEALMGRFALFLYPPDVLQMEEADRIRVATHINGDDAPALCEWSGGEHGRTVPQAEVDAVGPSLEMFCAWRVAFPAPANELATLPEFLAKFAYLLVRETGGKLALDGRRLGFLHRNLLANRAVELAKAELSQTVLPRFPVSARYTIQASIPIGLNGERIDREEAEHKMQICFDLLSDYFEERAEMARVNLVYELFTTGDLMRKAEFLLTHASVSWPSPKRGRASWRRSGTSRCWPTRRSKSRPAGQARSRRNCWRPCRRKSM